MSVDRLPFDVLIVGALIAWCVLGALLLRERRARRLGRIHHAHRYGGLPHQLTAGRDDGGADHEVENRESNRDDEHEDNEANERRIIHGGIVRHPAVIMPPGIPSITERLDRWKGQA